MNVIDTSKMSREEWLALRRQSIGASDAPVIAGLSKYKSRFQLWLEKTGQAETEEAGEEARWGNRLEDDIAEELEFQFGTRPARTQAMVYHPEYPWMHATLDMVDTNGETWQFKASGIGKAKTLINGENSTLPNDWIIQSHQEMMCFQNREHHIATFIGHRLRLAHWLVPFDEEIAHGIIQLNTEFRRHVEDRTPPTEFDPQDAAVLLRHYRTIEGDEIVNSNPKLAELCEQYEIADAAAKFQSELADQCKAAILAQMKTAPALRCQNYLMRRSQVNVKAQEPKPRAAYSYTKFTFTNTEREDS